MPNVGRNDPCPCGSGKKHKKCCLNTLVVCGDENENELTTIHSGLAMHQAGNLEGAKRVYLGRLSREANDVDALHLLGVVSHQEGCHLDAVALIERSLALRPGSAVALSNLASAQKAAGFIDASLSSALTAVQMSSEPMTRSGFVECVRDVRFGAPMPGMSEALISALEEPWGRPESLAAAVVSMLRQDPNIKDGVERSLAKWPVLLGDDELWGAGINPRIPEDPLLLALLGVCAVVDLGLERWLISLRAGLARRASDRFRPIRLMDAKATRLAAALGRQCFINERIWMASSDELAQSMQALGRIELGLERDSNIEELDVCIVGCYGGLGLNVTKETTHHEHLGVHDAHRLLDRSWTPEVRALLRQQVEEPAIERAIGTEMPIIGAIEDEVSKDVRAQYESNPYPRWVRVRMEPSMLHVGAQLVTEHPALASMAQGTAEVLIAGCGTGRHALEMAMRYPKDAFLGIDLSTASLAYAERRRREMDVGNIAHVQADILSLRGWDRRFDLIESVGVLHHMRDPLEGGLVLHALLKKGGAMKIGLYSAAARSVVEQAREFAKAHGFGTQIEDIRACRQALMDDPSERFKPLLGLKDFYGASEFRDLVFHGHEKLFDIQAVNGMLDEMGMSFAGFVLPPRVRATFCEYFKCQGAADPAWLDLKKWNDFEVDHPDSFIGMYQFYAFKK